MLPTHYISQLARLGLETHNIARSEIQSLRAAHNDYFWFCAKRDPIKRLISSYRSKIHRYAIHVDRKAYWRGVLGQILEGPKAIDDSRYLAKHVARRISFDELIAGLSLTGVSFDAHFEQQHKITCLDLIAYNAILAQENLEQDFSDLCKNAGLPQTDLSLRTLNASSLPRENSATPSPESLQTI